jgi:hypothetical protein
MRFGNILEFENLKTHCEFCGGSLSTSFLPKKTPSFRPKYNMGFQATTFTDPSLIILEDLEAGDGGITYTSQDYQNDLVFQYEFMDRANFIFSVNKTDNKIVGELDKVQKVIWDHDLHLIRSCKSQGCKEKGNHYVATSSRLVLERIQKKVCGFQMEAEMVSIKSGDRKFGLLSPYHMSGKSFLIAMEPSKIITQLPFMHLYKIKGGDVILNKIKTLITFS